MAERLVLTTQPARRTRGSWAPATPGSCYRMGSATSAPVRRGLGDAVGRTPRVPRARSSLRSGRWTPGSASRSQACSTRPHRASRPLCAGGMVTFHLERAWAKNRSSFGDRGQGPASVTGPWRACPPYGWARRGKAVVCHQWAGEVGAGDGLDEPFVAQPVQEPDDGVHRHPGPTGERAGVDAVGVVDEQEHVACPLRGLPPCRDYGGGGAVACHVGEDGRAQCAGRPPRLSPEVDGTVDGERTRSDCRGRVGYGQGQPARQRGQPAPFRLRRCAGARGGPVLRGQHGGGDKDESGPSRLPFLIFSLGGPGCLRSRAGLPAGIGQGGVGVWLKAVKGDVEKAAQFLEEGRVLGPRRDAGGGHGARGRGEQTFGVAVSVPSGFLDEEPRVVRPAGIGPQHDQGETDQRSGVSGRGRCAQPVSGGSQFTAA
ncbi:hypothetical protein RKD30_000008 [Streptomyces pristinaespiralis]